MSHICKTVYSGRLDNAINEVYNKMFIESAPLAAEYAVTQEPVYFKDRNTLKFKPIKAGETWGAAWDCGWFHLRGQVPAAWKGSYVILKLNFGGESILFDNTGDPVMGFTAFSVFDHSFIKDRIHLYENCKGGEKIDMWVDVGANTMYGNDIIKDHPRNAEERKRGGDFKVRYMDIVRFDPEAWHLWMELDILRSYIGTMKDDDNPRKRRAMTVVDKALDKLSTDGIAACREALTPLFAMRSDPGTVDVTGIGHAHIDTAWLWPLRECPRKDARTWATQVSLIERYPDYVFGASQPQQYEFVKEHYPTLYAKIKKAVKAGRWEVQGGMWVEPDCNVPSGESLVRQLLFGKNFFKDEFGEEVRNLWLPDVFGYSANLPQILQNAGCPYFLTQKLSWSRYTAFPHNTFIWRGIDGSEVVSHFLPERTYNSRVLPEDIIHNEDWNKDAGIVNDCVSLFGIGDGGGGPAEEYVERALIMRDFNGIPRYRMGKAQPALERMGKQRDDLETWSGELYLEMHRGTLTTQAAMKYWHRRAEEAFRAAEMVCTAAGVKSYPRAELGKMWKMFLTCEFHDILPGSSINRVYREAVPELQGIVATCKQLGQNAAARILKADKDAITFFNPSGTIFFGMVTLPKGWKGVDDGCGAEAAFEGDRLRALVCIEPRSFKTLRRSSRKCSAEAAIEPAGNEKRFTLENDGVRYVFDRNMRLVEAFDKDVGAEIIPQGDYGNKLEIFDDKPVNFDAWDVEEYLYKCKLGDAVAESIDLLRGPFRSGIEARMRIGENSAFTLTVTLESCTKRLDFHVEADWDESHKIMRVAFPTTVVSSRASFEIQYGVHERTTTCNTLADYAQFEVVGHRFADLSDRDYGVALLNDSKYGYKVKGSEMSMSLIRAPKDPDDKADIGHHSFTYSLLPHAGSFDETDARDEVFSNAAIINQGVEIFEGLAADEKTEHPLPVDVDGAGIELSVVKKAEKSEDIIIRVNECYGRRNEATINAPGYTIRECDSMEWNNIGAATRGSQDFWMRPYGIKTFRLTKGR